ncbi:curli assembly protein CsgF [Paucibacter sp. TC2R-5]|uniref:curli assembly protein CsgF n=1 Tax=Paucibacter sp. TC2R-5 TaxID=2893555 RepID=UPI0021E491DF|nr:curli assembly protein CsgF [Paucibacter sp. TC2R-5]MCV2359157.1 curli assembly protein CsgF [Paucibacter sp. TC2R-5]
MNYSYFSFRAFALSVLALMSVVDVSATELIYAPINPSFGGNPNNAPGLMAIANAQNSFKAHVNSPLENFNNSLQQAILSRLSSQSLATIFGKSSTLVPGTYDTLAYTITITDSGKGMLTIATTDKKTGATVTFEVSSTDVSVGP